MDHNEISNPCKRPDQEKKIDQSLVGYSAQLQRGNMITHLKKDEKLWRHLAVMARAWRQLADKAARGWRQLAWRKQAAKFQLVQDTNTTSAIQNQHADAKSTTSPKSGKHHGSTAAGCISCTPQGRRWGVDQQRCFDGASRMTKRIRIYIYIQPVTI